MRSVMSSETPKLENAPKNANGDFIDINTKRIIPQEGPYDIGHVQGQSWRTRKEQHQRAGHTRKEVIEALQPTD